jgi:hypothetical protein
MIFDLIIIVVGLNVLATIALWREAARNPPEPKKKFIAELLHSAPIEPKHEPPKAVAQRFESSVTEWDRMFFDDFADFATVVNWWFASAHDGSPCRLQELPDTILKLDRNSDMPSFGRRYSIFHNQVRLGNLEISSSFPYGTEDRNVHSRIELDSIRLLAFDSILELLDAIAMHVSYSTPDTLERLQARLTIISALTEAVWESWRISEFGVDSEDWGMLELGFDGSAHWYFTRREALRKQTKA